MTHHCPQLKDPVVGLLILRHALYPALLNAELAHHALHARIRGVADGEALPRYGARFVRIDGRAELLVCIVMIAGLDGDVIFVVATHGWCRGVGLLTANAGMKVLIR